MCKGLLLGGYSRERWFGCRVAEAFLNDNAVTLACPVFPQARDQTSSPTSMRRGGGPVGSTDLSPHLEREAGAGGGAGRGAGQEAAARGGEGGGVVEANVLQELRLREQLELLVPAVEADLRIACARGALRKQRPIEGWCEVR